MSRLFNRVDRELVELAIDLVASGGNPDLALSCAAQRLHDAGRKGIRFAHVLALETERVVLGNGADARVTSLRALLVTMGPG